MNSYNMDSPSEIAPGILSDLQKLVVQNPELEKLEGLLDRFNIFESLGAVRQEVRHSDFLSFLLNPRQNHGLGDLFVKRLLQQAIARADFPQPITPIDLDLWDLDDIEIRREWQSIDIFLVDEALQLMVIIENKIDTGEHDDQLTRYDLAARQHYPAFHLVRIYLTPDGAAASQPNYIAISYGLVCQLVEDILQSRESLLGRDVLVMLNHYVEMLRRYIVGESEIEKLCQQIYRKHQRALDLIFEYRPDQQAEIKDILIELIHDHPDLELDHASKTYTFFLPKKWDLPVLRQGQGWTRSGRMLMFQFENRQDSLKLSLVLGPGPEAIRETIFILVSQHEPPFKRSFKALGRLYSTVYVRNILTRSSYQEKSLEENRAEIQRRLDDFLAHELPKMDAILEGELERLARN